MRRSSSCCIRALEAIAKRRSASRPIDRRFVFSVAASIFRSCSVGVAFRGERASPQKAKNLQTLSESVEGFMRNPYTRNRALSSGESGAISFFRQNTQETFLVAAFRIFSEIRREPANAHAAQGWG